MISQLPGDAPLVARISLPEDGFQTFLSNGVDTLLKFVSGNKLGIDSDLPGFDLSARELLKFPSGDFVFAGGSSRTKHVSLPNGQAITRSTPIWASGMKIAHPLAFRELLAGINSGMGLSSVFDAHQLTLLSPKIQRGFRLMNIRERLSSANLSRHFHFNEKNYSTIINLLWILTPELRLDPFANQKV